MQISQKAKFSKSVRLLPNSKIYIISFGFSQIITINKLSPATFGLLQIVRTLQKALIYSLVNKIIFTKSYIKIIYCIIGGENMSDCKCNCSYISIIAGIVLGVALGVLFALGLVGTGIVFWVYLALGIAGVLLAPIYGFLNSLNESCSRCFCSYKGLLLTASIGTIITAAASLIIAPLGVLIATAIAISISTFFAVMFLAAVICLTRCIRCRK